MLCYVCLPPVSCVPNDARVSVSGLSICGCPFGFLLRLLLLPTSNHNNFLRSERLLQLVFYAAGTWHSHSKAYLFESHPKRKLCFLFVPHT